MSVGKGLKHKNQQWHWQDQWPQKELFDDESHGDDSISLEASGDYGTVSHLGRARPQASDREHIRPKPAHAHLRHQGQHQSKRRTDLSCPGRRVVRENAYQQKQRRAVVLLRTGSPGGGMATVPSLSALSRLETPLKNYRILNAPK